MELEKVKTNRGDKPLEDVVMEKVTVDTFEWIIRNRKNVRIEWAATYEVDRNQDYNNAYGS